MSNIPNQPLDDNERPDHPVNFFGLPIPEGGFIEGVNFFIGVHDGSGRVPTDPSNVLAPTPEGGVLTEINLNEKETQ